MFSLWFVFVYLMAVVIPRGHGGHGAGDPPYPDPFWRGTHEIDRKLSIIILYFYFIYYKCCH
ncbi:hypothetical protein Hanom_Chr05g00421211 [Helianthus anomalus]